MHKRLTEMKKYLNLANEKFIMSRKIKVHKLKARRLINQYKIDFSKLNEDESALIKKAIHLIGGNKNYIVISKSIKHIVWRIISTKFNVMTQIALTKTNSNITNVLCADNDLFCLEIHYIVSFKNGKNYGKELIKHIFIISNLLKIPIVLYCESDLVEYYKKLGFKQYDKNTKGESLMIYFNCDIMS